MNLITTMTEKLREAFPDADIDVRNPNDDGAHFEASIASARFDGMGRVQQHRLVYAALGDVMQDVHALALATKSK